MCLAQRIESGKHFSTTDCKIAIKSAFAVSTVDCYMYLVELANSVNKVLSFLETEAKRDDTDTQFYELEQYYRDLRKKEKKTKFVQMNVRDAARSFRNKLRYVYHLFTTANRWTVSHRLLFFSFQNLEFKRVTIILQMKSVPEFRILLQKKLF